MDRLVQRQKHGRAPGQEGVQRRLQASQAAARCPSVGKPEEVADRRNLDRARFRVGKEPVEDPKILEVDIPHLRTSRVGRHVGLGEDRLAGTAITDSASGPFRPDRRAEGLVDGR